MSDAALDTPVLRRDAAEVHLSEDAGAYYCAHVLFLMNQLAHPRATSPGGSSSERSSFVENAHGEPLVGFLHVPRDPACPASHPTVAEEVRHAKTRVVVAAALRGYVDEALERGAPLPIRVLVTGFGPFRDVLSNPTGDFVTRPENVRTSLRLAFGPSFEMRSAPQKLLAGPRASLCCLCLEVPWRGRSVPLEVGLACLPVDDDALDPSATDSLPALLARFRPHAMLCMGVGRPGEFRVEVRPDDRGLCLEGPRPVHEPDRPASVALPKNLALARAITRGGARLDTARRAASITA